MNQGLQGLRSERAVDSILPMGDRIRRSSSTGLQPASRIVSRTRAVFSFWRVPEFL